MPRPTRSSHSGMSRACFFVSPKMFPQRSFRSIVTTASMQSRRSNREGRHPPRRAPLQLHGLHFRGRPFERFHLRDEAKLFGVIEVQLQPAAIFRSEEHTSEIQSQSNL